MKGLHLHFDCASGIAGDMTLGALLDLGVPVAVVGDALDAVGAGRQRLRVERVTKGGIAATNVTVDTKGQLFEGHTHSHGPRPKRATTESGGFVAVKFRAETHERHIHIDEQGDKTTLVHHDHAHDHSHTHYADIRKRITEAKLTEGTRRRALDIFDRLAKAEAKLHGSTVELVMFHEVGAIDSIVDIVGTAAALDWLAPASVTCAEVAMGHGTLKCAHGVLPVPAPASLEVLRDAGGVMTDGGLARELCTPTGAAILAATVTSWMPAPRGKPVAIGWGAGDFDLPDRANVLRATVLQPVTTAAAAIWQIDANIDDMSPELCAPAADAVFAAGAVDVWWTPITMKKGRPALTLSALAEPDKRDAVIAAILRETTTIGVRYTQLERTVLARRIVEVQTRFGPIPVKVALEGDAVRNAAPEYDACVAAAKAHAVPVKTVFAAAIMAYEATRT
ncbi:MAG: nickel pincer cofactor biosynthesis protein LarC [Deltaproteobacteria bacterium]|nr:nickel pincer cofactor biosynthesis protein LarC [Deltaproteobacteria bacterium]